MKNRILTAILSLLGFATACDKFRENNEVCMYGTPRMNFRVQGTVTDAEGKPIPDIKVAATYGSENSVRTSSDGTYDFSETDVSGPFLTFIDTDGPANGGEFAEQKFMVEFTEADRTEKSDGWFRGTFERSDVNVTLDKKSDTEE